MKTSTYIDSDNVGHGEKGRQTSAQLGGEPRTPNLVGL